MRPQALDAPRRVRRVRPDRRARLQPDVRDDRGPGEGDRFDDLSAAGDRAGHLRQLQERAPVRAPAAAVRYRAGRKVVSQRDHAGELHLPHARVRADGDGVLRAARRGRKMVRVLDRTAALVVSRTGDAREPSAPAAPRRRRALALLLADERHRVPLPDRVVGARGDREPRRLRPHPPLGVLGGDARVLRPAGWRALRAARDRAGRRRRPRDAGVHRRCLRRGGCSRARPARCCAFIRGSRR